MTVVRKALLVEEAAEVRTLRKAAIRAQGLDEERLSALLDDFELIEKSLSSALGIRIYSYGQARGEETSGLGDPREDVRSIHSSSFERRPGVEDLGLRLCLIRMHMRGGGDDDKLFLLFFIFPLARDGRGMVKYAPTTEERF